MIDSREIQVLDNSFELSETIAENEQLTKINKQLIYFTLVASLLLVGITFYFVKDKPSDESSQ